MNPVIPYLHLFFDLAVILILGSACGRWERRARKAWREELQLLEWLEDFGYGVGRMPDGSLVLLEKPADPEEARLARDRYDEATPNKNIPRPKLGDL